MDMKEFKMPYNKLLINFDRSVFRGEYQTSVLRIDLAVARTIRLDLGLIFSPKVVTLS